MTDMMNYSHGFGMGGGMWFLTIIFWLFVIVGIFIILHALLDKKAEPDVSLHTTGQSALEILQMRFAKGEIDEDTFKRMKKDIEE